LGKFGQVSRMKSEQAARRCTMVRWGDGWWSRRVGLAAVAAIMGAV
jgi:hypothetical protein